MFLFNGTQEKGKRKQSVSISTNIQLAFVLWPAILIPSAYGFHSLLEMRRYKSSMVLPSWRVRNPQVPFTVYRPSLSHLSVTTGDSETFTRETLQKLTVKQLKERIKDLDSNVKISQLKLKKDLVDYLVTYNKPSFSEKEESPPSTLETSSRIQDMTQLDSLPSKKTARKKTLNMPPLRAELETDTGAKSLKKVSLKEAIFEKVFTRYPPLRQLNNDMDAREERILQGTEEMKPYENHIRPSANRVFSGLGDLDIRQKYHPMLANLTSSDLDIITVGTASCVPGVTRGVSCTALRLQWRRNTDNVQNSAKDDDSATGGIWIFDCGESTQLQVQRTGSVRPGKISKIFITHAHGDHSFGLPGLLCIMGQDRDRNSPPVDIYGPEGLRIWLRTAIRYSVSRIVPPYRVHELMDIPMAPEWTPNTHNKGRFFYQPKRSRQNGPWGTQGLAGQDPVSWISRAPMIMLDPSPQFGEIAGGRDIYPSYHHEKCVDGAPIWEVEDEGDVKVYAAPMSHGVPCVGYVVQEENKPGRLRNDLVEPIARRNIDGLKKLGMKIPMKVMATIKDLPKGASYTFPDGTTVYQSEVVEPERLGRKVVICGDTADSRAIAGLAEGADVLIHEATNAYLSGVDKDGSKKATAIDAKIHGHCTPVCAGEFAKKIGAKRLVMNHFSSRYKGDQSVDSLSIMTRIEEQAIASSGLRENMVAASWDFMILPVPQN